MMDAYIFHIGKLRKNTLTAKKEGTLSHVPFGFFSLLGDIQVENRFEFYCIFRLHSFCKY